MRTVAPREGRGDKPFSKACVALNKKLKRLKSTKRFSIHECADAYQYYSGRCAFCSRPLHVREFGAKNGVHFIFYLPIEYGGQASFENLIPVCPACEFDYRGTREIRQAIPDLNTFPDVFEILVEAIITREKNPTFETVEKVRLLKRYLNMILEDTMRSLRYKPFTDWKSKTPIFFKDNLNTIAEVLENMTTATINENEKEKEKSKEELKESVKQILGNKTYKILRNIKDENIL